jgi:transcription elongation factor SPT5
VIIKVDRDTFRVLDQNGEVRTIQPHQITNKRDSKRAVATDANGNSIQAGDTVIEKDGERRSGTILHLYRQLVFLHSREYVQNFGVWVTRTRSVASVAAKGGRAVGLGKGKLWLVQSIRIVANSHSRSTLQWIPQNNSLIITET